MFDVVEVGDQVLGLGVAEGLDSPCGVARIVTHHHHRRRVEAIDQQTRLFIDRQVERTKDASFATSREPALSGGEQGCKHLAIIFGGNHPEVPLLGIGHQRVDLRTDAPDVATVSTRQPELRRGVLEIRVLGWRQRFAAFQHERRDVARVGLVKPPRQLDESVQFGGR